MEEFMKDDAYNTGFLVEGEYLPAGYDNIEGEGRDAPFHGPFKLRMLDASLYLRVESDKALSTLMNLTAPAHSDMQYPHQFVGFSKRPHHEDASREIQRLFGSLKERDHEVWHLPLDVQDSLYRHELAVQDEFAEYIVIDRSEGLMHTLVVSSA